MEEKLKKVTTEKAPVAGQTTGGAGGGVAGRFGRQPTMGDIGDDALTEALQAAMRDGAGGGAALSEMLRQSAQGTALNEMLRGSGQSRGLPDIFAGLPGRGGDEGGEGAAAAAGVLTAVDEGEDEADVPGEFEYFTDNEDGEEEEL